MNVDAVSTRARRGGHGDSDPRRGFYWCQGASSDFYHLKRNLLLGSGRREESEAAFPIPPKSEPFPGKGGGASDRHGLGRKAMQVGGALRPLKGTGPPLPCLTRTHVHTALYILKASMRETPASGSKKERS